MNELKPIKSLVQKTRITICEECGLTKLRRCPDCGCFMDAKTRIMGARCPQGKWQAMTTENLIELHNELAAGGDE
jgi:tRNA(Ile2) C34 agmatinyltransferase TiaS